MGSLTYLLGAMQDVCSKVFTQNSDGWNTWAYMRLGGWPFLLKVPTVFVENLLYTCTYTISGRKNSCQVSKSQKLSTVVYRKDIIRLMMSWWDSHLFHMVFTGDFGCHLFLPLFSCDCLIFILRRSKSKYEVYLRFNRPLGFVQMNGVLALTVATISVWIIAYLYTCISVSCYHLECEMLSAWTLFHSKKRVSQVTFERFPQKLRPSSNLFPPFSSCGTFLWKKSCTTWNVKKNCK